MATPAACASGWRVRCMRLAIRPGRPTTSPPTTGRRPRRSPARSTPTAGARRSRPSSDAAGALLSAKVEALVGLGAEAEPAIVHDGPPAARRGDGARRDHRAAGRQARARGRAPEPEEIIALPPAEDAAAAPQPPHADSVRRRAPSRHSRREPKLLSFKESAEPAARKDSRRDGARPALRQARPRKPTEPKIFVPPRAPDDPGPESSEADDGLGHDPFGPSPAKA